METPAGLDDLDCADLHAAGEQWSGLLRDHYATTPPGRFERFETLFEEVPSDFLGEQIATHLENLGYLSEIDGAGLTPASVWRPALDVWAADHRAAGHEGEPEVRVDLGDEELEKLTADERAIRLLKAQCSFEGETQIGAPSRTPEDTLAARIARHRLRTFGFVAPGAGLGASDQAAEREVEAELSRPSFPAIAWLDLLGDIAELTSRFVQTQDYRVFVFGRTPAAAARYTQFRLKRRSKVGLGQATFRSGAARRRHELAGAMSAVGDHRASLRPTVEPGLVEGRTPDDERPSPALCRFALYLLQVRLWMLGYYAGALDGRWGVMTARALERFIVEHESEDSRAKEALAARHTWLRGDSNELVIDLGYLFSFMVARIDEAAEITARDEIDSLVNASLQSDQTDTAVQARVSEAELDLSREVLAAHEERRRLQRADREAVDAAGAASGVRRRRYFGWRAIFGLFGRALRWVGRSIKRTLQWFKERIRKLVHYATAFLNYIREKTRRAVRLVALGFQRLYCWLCGEPVGTARGDSLVLTGWSIDFDTITVTRGLVDDDIAGDHGTRLDCLNAGFGFLIEVALGVWAVMCALKYAMANWLLLAWRAFKAVRRALEYIDDNAALIDRLEPAVL